MLRYVGIFSNDCFVHLTLLIDIVALAQRPKSTVVYTINGSAVRAFPNESECMKQAVAVYSYLFIYQYVYQYAECIVHRTVALLA